MQKKPTTRAVDCHRRKCYKLAQAVARRSGRRRRNVRTQWKNRQQRVPESKSYKYLGVIMQSSRSWHQERRTQGQRQALPPHHVVVWRTPGGFVSAHWHEAAADDGVAGVGVWWRAGAVERESAETERSSAECSRETDTGRGEAHGGRHAARRARLDHSRGTPHYRQARLLSPPPMHAAHQARC